MSGVAPSARLAVVASENRAAVEQAGERFNAGDLDGYLELYDEGVALHGFPPGLPPGKDGARAFYGAVFAGLENRRLTFEDVIEEGDRLAFRFTFEATHEGDLLGLAPTGRQVHVDGLTILRFRNGKVVERWQAAAEPTLMQQLA